MLALTFDDGPSESTPELLRLLSHFGIRATFFMCGEHVRRLPEVVSEVVAGGHEIGNHTQHHARLWLRSSSFLLGEIAAAQQSIREVTGTDPRWFRAPYGVRWPGLAGVQEVLCLTGVMWTVIGNDWSLPPNRIAARLVGGASAGGILCLHDGRELRRRPDIRPTLEAVEIAVPKLLAAGYRFGTVSEMFIR